MSLETFNIGGIWTMLVGTAVAIVYMFNTFVTHAQFSEFSVEVLYDSFYRTIDRLDKAKKEQSSEDYIQELQRRLERLKGKICEEDPEWERCDKP